MVGGESGDCAHALQGSNGGAQSEGSQLQGQPSLRWSQRRGLTRKPGRRTEKNVVFFHGGKRRFFCGYPCAQCIFTQPIYGEHRLRERECEGVGYDALLHSLSLKRDLCRGKRDLRRGKRDLLQMQLLLETLMDVQTFLHIYIYIASHTHT